jgi:hypothetical protein
VSEIHFSDIELALIYMVKKSKEIFELRVLSVGSAAVRKELLVLPNAALSQPSKKTGKCICSERMVFPLPCKSYRELPVTNPRHCNKSKVISLKAAISEWTLLSC